jgi:AcrR family transcriptional regulator
MKHSRKKPEIRKAEILTAALDLACLTHYSTVTRDQVATAAGVSPAAVQYHFSTMTKLRGEVMRAAVKREVLLVVAQGLLAKNAHVVAISEELRAKARGCL